MALEVGHMNLRKPSKEEIDKITVEMVTKVQSTYNLRNRILNDNTSKSSSIFIKDVTHKSLDTKKGKCPLVVKAKSVKDKKWEPKNSFLVQNVDKRKKHIDAKGPKLGTHSHPEATIEKPQEDSGKVVKFPLILPLI